MTLDRKLSRLSFDASLPAESPTAANTSNTESEEESKQEIPLQEDFGGFPLFCTGGYNDQFLEYISKSFKV